MLRAAQWSIQGGEDHLEKGKTMKKTIHIADGYDRVVEEDSDGTIHEVKPDAKKTADKAKKPKTGSAIDEQTRKGKTSSNVWI